jgi:hypothetical protein
MNLAQGAGANPAQVRRALLRASPLNDSDTESLHLTTGKSILDAPLLACSYFMEPLGGYFVNLRQKN